MIDEEVFALFSKVNTDPNGRQVVRVADGSPFVNFRHGGGGSAAYGKATSSQISDYVRLRQNTIIGTVQSEWRAGDGLGS